MFDNLLGLLKESYSDGIESQGDSNLEKPDSFDASPTHGHGHHTPGQSRHIGYNYMRRMGAKPNLRSRKFINLTKLLRGDYRHE